MIGYDMSKVNIEEERKYEKDNWGRWLHNGIYDVDRLDCLPVHGDSGYYLMALQRKRKDVRDFIAKYPNWVIAAGYCTRSIVLVEKRPTPLVDISHNNGATSLHEFIGKVLVVVSGDDT